MVLIAYVVLAVSVVVVVNWGINGTNVGVFVVVGIIIVDLMVAIVIVVTDIYITDIIVII